MTSRNCRVQRHSRRPFAKSATTVPMTPKMTRGRTPMPGPHLPSLGTGRRFSSPEFQTAKRKQDISVARGACISTRTCLCIQIFRDSLFEICLLDKYQNRPRRMCDLNEKNWQLKHGQYSPGACGERAGNHEHGNECLEDRERSNRPIANIRFDLPYLSSGFCRKPNHRRRRRASVKEIQRLNGHR